MSIRRQCELVGLNRSTFYYTPARESDLNLYLMRLIDVQYTKTPFYGWRRMTAQLRRQGNEVNHKRVQRLMQKMGLEAIYPKRRTTIAAQGHKVYPYLLRNLSITHPNQVWSSDITYIRMRHGFMYLVAVIDWHSRYVWAWQLSNAFDGLFCQDIARPKGGRVDLALAVLVLHHVPAPEDALRELGRIVKPGGRLLIVEQQTHQLEAFHERMQDRWWGFEPAKLTRAVAAAGFEDIHCRALATHSPESRAVESPELFTLTAHRSTAKGSNRKDTK